MNIELDRDELLTPLSWITGLVERRQSLPILGFVLLRIRNGTAVLSGTDTEIEVTATMSVKRGSEDAEVLLPARKAYDICRALPAGAKLRIKGESERLAVKSGRSRFTLSTLSPGDFPETSVTIEGAVAIEADDLRELLTNAAFCMAQQDVRYFLNGLLLETEGSEVRAVATDGHRLAFGEKKIGAGGSRKGIVQAIIPRKAVAELVRLLGDTSGEVSIALSASHARIQCSMWSLTTKLIDGKYPDYRRVIPSDFSRGAEVDRAGLLDALNRVTVIASEKGRAAQLGFQEKSLRITAKNQEQEEVSEEMDATLSGADVEIGLNVSYLLEIARALKGETIRFGIKDSDSGCVVTGTGTETEQGTLRYVIMPMRI